MGGCGDMFYLGAKMWNYPVIGTPSVDKWVKYQDVQYDQLRIIFNYCRQLKYITCVTCCKV